MSQQLQITGGAKVRSLEGVITGSTGVLGSLPINGSNGIPQLDSNGKILVSQLPNSVMEYLGTWNASTNTPTLANGTGNAGDVYLCNVAGTVNFGAGPITFYVGDQVIYSGTIWQRASGATGSVTSVAVTETGDALTITGSPITTSGTINIGFAGTSAQYVAGDGTLVTFPTITTEAQRLITEVYNETGATLTKGTVVYINGGHGNLPTIAKALATSDATSAQTYGVVQTDIGNNNNGFVVVIGSLNNIDTQAYSNGTQLYLSSTTAGAWTSTKQYAPAHLVYVGIVTRSHPTQGVVEIKIQNGYELDELHNVSAQTPSNNDGIFYNTSTSLWESKSIATALGYTPVPTTRTLTINGTTYDLSADRSWTITAGVSGSGTTNYLSKWTSSTALGDSLLFDNGTNVGIGTASPSYKLDVNGTGRYLGNVFINPSNVSVLGLEVASEHVRFRPDSTNTTTPKLLDIFTGSGNAVLFSVGGYGTFYDTDMSFYTQNASTGPNSLPNLFLKSNGNVGIYNYTPSYRLDVTGTGRFTDQLRLDSTITNGTYTYTLPSATGTLALTSDLNGFVPTSRTLTINGIAYNLSTDRSWTISSSQWTTTGSNIYYNTGNVGIGTTTPTDSSGFGTILDLNGSTASAYYTRYNGSSTIYALFGQDSTTTYLLTKSTPLSFYINNAERARINNSGNVSIGNTNDTYKLDVSGTGTFRAANGVNIIGPTGNPAYLTTDQSVNNGGKRWRIGHTGAASGWSSFDIYNQTDNITALSITAAGLIGIGTTSPSFSDFSTNTTGINISNQSSNYAGLKLTGNTAYTTGSFGLYSGSAAHYLWGGGSNPMIFATNDAERMRIDSNGCVNIGGTAGFGKLDICGQVNGVASNICRIGNTAGVNNGLLVSKDTSNVYTFDFGGSSIIKSLYTYNNPFGGAANLGLTSTGEFYRSTSSIKYKTNIVNYDKGLAEVLKMRPVYYNSKNEAENGITFAGLIAEEVHELGLTEFVQYAEDGTPDALAYQNMIALLVKAVQELKAEIEELKNK